MTVFSFRDFSGKIFSYLGNKCQCSRLHLIGKWCQYRSSLKIQHPTIFNGTQSPYKALPIRGRLILTGLANVKGIWCKSITPSLSWICSTFSRWPRLVKKYSKSIPMRLAWPVSKQNPSTYAPYCSFIRSIRLTTLSTLQHGPSTRWPLILS